MKRIIVCIKQVLDPEAPPSSFKIDPEAKRAVAPKGVPPVLNPFDENALEAALRPNLAERSAYRGYASSVGSPFEIGG